MDSSLYVFYSWNEDIKTKELYAQLKDFSSRGVTGVFIHARGGLSLPYMGKEWFNAFAYAVRTAEKLGLEVGIYDENGWPSGFGGGKVNGLGERYQQKKLRVERNLPSGQYIELLAAYKKAGSEYVRCDASEGEIFAFTERNPDYVDLLAPWVTEAFIASTHEVYRKKFGVHFGKTIKYLFSDEPQLAAPYAYTEQMREIFFGEYGYDLFDELWKFAFITETFSRFHYDYRRLISKLFRENYTKKIADWCEANNLLFTGHFACEESTVTLNLNGGVMNGYEYMQAPGVDALGKRLPPEQLFEQLASAKNIFGKKYALSETFGCSGWSATLEDFKYYWANQAARGVNLPCLHLSAYSIRGIRKRDYPAFFSYQEPWWNHLRNLTEFMQRSSEFVSCGRYSDVLVVAPDNSALGLTPDCAANSRLANSYTTLIRSLTECQIAFDIIGGEQFARYACVQNGKIRVKNGEYGTLVFVSDIHFSPEVSEIIKAVYVNGVHAAVADCLFGELPKGCDEIYSCYDSVEDYFRKIEYKRKAAAYGKNGEIDRRIVARKYERGFTWFNGDRTGEAKVRIFADGASYLKIVGTNRIEQETIALRDGFADVELQAGQLLLAEKGESGLYLQTLSKTVLSPKHVARLDANAITIDKAKYSLDGNNYSELQRVLDIEENLAKNGIRRAWVRYSFDTEYVPEDLRLAVEIGATEIKVNGKLCRMSEEWYVDTSIRTVFIADIAVSGTNTVDVFYEAKTDEIRSSEALDSENEIARNLFTYDLEIENIYLLGSFSVRVQEYEYCKNTVYVPKNSFATVVPQELEWKDLAPQGLWFYRGSISAEISLPKIKDGECGFIRLTGGEQCSAEIFCGKKSLGVLASCDETADVSDFCGKSATLVLTVSNRNLLGPFHHVAGDPAIVGGNTFRGVRGFEDEWLESRHRVSTYVEGYHFRRNSLPEVQFIIKKGI